MPSTYSTDLRIELIANGEQSGTWGTTTNSNLGTIIEDAISGLVTFNTAAQKYALTAVNGGADQARCAALAISTSFAGDFEIYVPPVTKLYVFKNTDTTYDATVYCSDTIGSTVPGGDGIIVSPGKTVLLQSDGTDITEQINHFVGDITFGDTGVSTGGDIAVRGSATITDSAFLGGSQTVTISIATPGVVTVSSGVSPKPGATIVFSTTGALPTGLTAGTTYYVRTSSWTSTTFTVSTTSASGSAVNTTGSQSGTQTMARVSLAVTPPSASNNTQIATTAFVQSQIQALSVPPTGSMTMWSTGTAPTGWLLCDGAAVSRTTYADLFAVISTTYGTGNGSTTFNVPNLENRVPIGAGGLYSLAATGGSRDAVIPTNTISTASLTGSLTFGGNCAPAMNATGIFDEVVGATADQPAFGNGQENRQFNIDASHTHTIVGASQTFTAATTDVITMASVGWDNNIAVRVSTSGTLPAGLSASTTYFIIDADPAAETCKLSTSVGGSAVNITSTGSGTQTMTIQEQSGVQRNLPPYLAINYIIKT
jgi:microcystin-dependent protein